MVDPDAVFGAIFQYPGVCGEFRDFSAIIAKLHAAKALGIQRTNLYRKMRSLRVNVDRRR